MLLGQSIRKLRIKNKQTQAQLAELIHIDQKQISMIESGRVQARLSTYLHIANAFGVSIDSLLADALLVTPKIKDTDYLSGKSEQQFIQNVEKAAICYLKEKETCHPYLNAMFLHVKFSSDNTISIKAIIIFRCFSEHVAVSRDIRAKSLSTEYCSG